ncbi:helix-turn-helix domain-containing protein [Herminiimonas arsenitoxidans]|uniref:helix-turn-helix domain-containing protein n=1 Tax=Herminiimonas arsenitoxidans TaxID=1809410 RepID=UPI000970C1BB|nr:helix-turn-helix transcriptional regulator [Herminiimonas arsenitoxidans]
MNATEQLDLLMRALDIRQSDLAEKLGVEVQRLKDIQRGKIKKMPADVSKALVDIFHVSPEWLVTKAGPVFKTDIAFAKIRKATDAAVEIALRFTSVSHGLLMDMQSTAFEEQLSADQLLERFKDRLPSKGLLPDEMALLDNYRTAGAEDKHTIDRMAALAAQSGRKNK